MSRCIFEKIRRFDAIPSRCQHKPPIMSSTSTAPRHLVLYDDECSLCTFQMKVLTWLDWFKVVRLAPISSADAQRLAPQLTMEALREAIHCVTPEGGIHRGARCIRFVGMRMPLLVPVALVLWFPGVIYVAEWIYRIISRNRYVLSRIFGCQGACAILPDRAAHQMEKGGRGTIPEK